MMADLMVDPDDPRVCGENELQQAMNDVANQ